MTAPGQSIYDAVIESRLALAWVNSYSAVGIRSGDATLLIDPVSMELPERASLELIAISHDHADHWDPDLVLDLQRRTGAKVAASPPLADRLKRSGVQNVTALRAGDCIQAGDLTLQAARCDHAATEPLSFVVQTSGGLRAYLPGDTTPFPEMGEVNADAVFWTGTSLSDGAEIARLVDPSVFLTYAIDPPKAGERAMGILSAKAPQVQFRALRRNQVFVV